MAKAGKEKNTKNKAKHSKLMAQKKNKLKKSKTATLQKKKELIQKFNAQKNKKIEAPKAG